MINRILDSKWFWPCLITANLLLTWLFSAAHGQESGWYYTPEGKTFYTTTIGKTDSVTLTPWTADSVKKELIADLYRYKVGDYIERRLPQLRDGHDTPFMRRDEFLNICKSVGLDLVDIIDKHTFMFIITYPERVTKKVKAHQFPDWLVQKMAEDNSFSLRFKGDTTWVTYYGMEVWLGPYLNTPFTRWPK